MLNLDMCSRNRVFSGIQVSTQNIEYFIDSDKDIQIDSKAGTLSVSIKTNHDDEQSITEPLKLSIRVYDQGLLRAQIIEHNSLKPRFHTSKYAGVENDHIDKVLGLKSDIQVSK